MTRYLSGLEVAKTLKNTFPEAVIEAGEKILLIKKEFLVQVAEYFKNSPEFDCDYLTSITAVDYYHYFEIIYQLSSLSKNHMLTLKVCCEGRSNLSLPSVVGLWRGADFQEREIFDLMGIRFEGHPNMKRIFLWEGFEGHPLRKDYL